VKFDGKPVAAWIAPALAYARQHGWKGTVNSGFRSFAEQTRIYNSRCPSRSQARDVEP
jgi:hypothetical protein